MLSKVFTSREQWLMIGSAAAICVGGVTYYVAKPAPPRTQEIVAVREVHVPAELSKPPTPVIEIKPEPTAPAPAVAPPTVAPQPIAEKKLQVMVGGAVAQPGLYEFESEARVSDAIKGAGDALPTADLSDINKAAHLIDGTVLTIPVAGTAAVEDGKRMVLRSGQSAAALNPAAYTISGWKNGARTTTGGGTLSTSSPGAAPAQTAAPTPSDGVLDLNTATADQLEALPGVGPKLAQAIMEYRARQPFQSVDDLNNVSGIGDKKLSDIRPHVRVGNP